MIDDWWKSPLPEKKLLHLTEPDASVVPDARENPRPRRNPKKLVGHGWIS